PWLWAFRHSACWPPAAERERSRSAIEWSTSLVSCCASFSRYPPESIGGRAHDWTSARPNCKPIAFLHFPAEWSIRLFFVKFRSSWDRTLQSRSFRGSNGDVFALDFAEVCCRQTTYAGSRSEIAKYPSPPPIHPI